MALTNDLIDAFVKVTNDKAENKQGATVMGTIVKYNDKDYVKLDGSELLTPVNSTIVSQNGDRVTVLIKDHTATVTGSTSSPSASNKDLQNTKDDVSEIGSKISEFEIVIADKVSTKEFDAEKGRIDDLTADNVKIKEKLTAQEGEIDNLTSDNVTIKEKLTAHDGEIENLNTKKLDSEIANIKYATIENLEVTDEKVNNLEGNYGEFKQLATDKFAANEADIKKLQTDKLDATEAELKYANIDFSNINQAAIEKVFSESGIIKDLIVSEGKITGELVGVTIKGDLIEGGTVKADKLVVKGSDGLYYKLNMEGGATTSEQVTEEDLQNGLSGSIIVAKSITAEKVAVDDLVAFGATIGGFNITTNSIYSGVKSSVNNTTRGVYLDKDGQFAIGDSNNYLRYFKDTDDIWKLVISAGSVVLRTSNKSVEEVVEELQKEANDAKTSAENAANSASAAKDVVDAYNNGELNGEDAILLNIHSSNGNSFKNSLISTTLTISIIVAGYTIDTSQKMYDYFGNQAKLKWKIKNMGETEYSYIPDDDERLSDNGFIFTLNANDIKTKAVLDCELDF